MPYFTETGDIIIEIDGEQVAGLTSIDIEQILSRSTKHTFKILTGQQHGFPLELREYLSRRFVRGSLDHKLQELIRDNIYSRTIPITTRPKRDNEIDGVDYRFVTKEQFIQMERSGLLLESGVYCNYYYGTALPSSTTNYSQENHLTKKNDIINMKNDESSSWTTMSAMAKRKRNRSNLVAIDAASLPYGWERISDSHYGVYYIDHINKRTQYERPYEIELVKGINGFGFTLIEIDKGLIVVKSLIQGGSASASGVIQSGDVLVSVAGISVSGYQHSDIAQLFQTFNVGDRIRLTFARGYQLPSGINDEDYDIINLKIIKGFQGFGFTISEGHNGQKVKKILDIERCCSLRQGDILISINGMDLQQLQHLDVVELLKQCPVNESTEFMVKRKKRFRSKTPNNNQSMTMPMMTANNNNNNNDIDIGSSLRNCKTPNEELFYQQQQQQHYNTLPTWNNINNNNNESTIQITNTQQQNNNNNINNDNDYQQYCDQYNENLDDYNQMMMMANSAASVDNNNHLYSNQQPIKQLQQQQQQQMDNYSNFPTIMMNSSLKVNQSAPLLSTNDRSSGTLFGQIDIDYEYHQIILNRTDTGFGFRIIGGAEDGSNVAIGSIVIGGSAHKDGTLKAGDELIAINGQYVVGSSHQDVVQLMAQTGSQVTILVRRKRYLNAYDVQLFRQDYEGFGFVIISCGNCALIGRIIEGSPAHRCQRLHIRDRIIAVNGIDVTNMSHPEIVNKIKESGIIVPADCYSCELIRGSNGYGFSIRGGAEFNGMPLFILAIATNGPASSLLQIGDEILEINERSTIGMTHQEAVQLISQSQPSVRLRMRHNYVGGEFFSTSLMSPPPPPPPQQQLSSISLPLPSSSSSSSQIIANRISSPQQQPPPPPPQSAGSPIMMQPVPSQSSSSSTAATVAATTAIANSSSSSSIPIQFPSTKYPSNMISY
uniref:Membrane-associated guanylate kinase, WW and PDZ domain-containing protein 2-like n=1 Tax=Dermatophagoides pteronyssinus TaxID=6956 RepID=A0A6P6YDE3_DERPT|nr:membrane-associated guanylate kinase, WW and PDZ domain-containing protein 2-like [Dermatophagoides pteronyssinus]